MSNNNLPKTRILIVDHDKMLLEMYTKRLNKAGYEVVFACDGEKALSKAVEHVPHVILLEVMMPKINGFEVLSILKSTRETKNIPVIMFTALSHEAKKKRGLSHGAEKYIVKSEVTPKQVVDMIEKVVKDNVKKIRKAV